MKYDKLVRDRIPAIIKKNGGNPKSHIASKAEFWSKLKAKLGEEAGELIGVVDKYVSTEEGEEKLIEETADFLEILDAVLRYRGDGEPLSGSQIERILSAKRKKARERGQFNNRIILEEA